MFEVLGVLIGVGGVILFGFISSGVWKKEKNIALNATMTLKIHLKTHLMTYFISLNFVENAKEGSGTIHTINFFNNIRVIIPYNIFLIWRIYVSRKNYYTYFKIK